MKKHVKMTEMKETTDHIVSVRIAEHCIKPWQVVYTRTTVYIVMDGDNKYCVKCGKELSSGAMYCDSCGKSAGDDTLRSGGSDRTTLRVATILIGIYAVLAIISSLIFLAFGDAMIDSLKGTYEPTQFGYDTWEAFRDAMPLVGGVSLASGVLAFVSFVLCRRREYFLPALLTCVVASLILFATGGGNFMIASNALGAAIGLIMALILYLDRDCFSS